MGIDHGAVEQAHGDNGSGSAPQAKQDSGRGKGEQQDGNQGQDPKPEVQG